MITQRVRLQLAADTIRYLTGRSNYTTVFFSDRPPTTYPITLARLTEDLPTFLRISKTYLVNPQHIEAYEYETKMNARILIDGQWLSISRRRAKAIDRRLKVSDKQKSLIF
jgi:DNA-binding LytR/AlgR family response regulator